MIKWFQSRKASNKDSKNKFEKLQKKFLTNRFESDIMVSVKRAKT